MIRAVLPGTTMLLLLVSAAWAQDLPIERYALPNGLQVILHVDHALPQVVVDVWYQVGSKDEAPGRSGFAHLFEHLMFMGTDRLPGSGIDQLMEANGGWNNAWTMEDATNYYDVGPPNLLSTLLWIEADRMEQLGAAMTQEKVDLQRDVVRNERRQTSEDTPYGVGELEWAGLLFAKDHPYGHTVIGTHDDLEAAKLQEIKDFFATWYVPNNASLVVAGDIDPVAIKPVIEQYFGHLPQRALPARVSPAAVTSVQKARVIVPDQVDLPQVTMLWHSPAAFTKDDVECQMLASLLAEGESSRLYVKLVKAGLAQEVLAYQNALSLGGTFLIQATAMEGVSIEKIEGIIQDELAAIARTPPSAAEMERLHNQSEYAFLAGLQPLQNRAEMINRYLAYTGDPNYLAQDLARYRGVTAQGIAAATAAWLQPSAGGAVVVVPEASIAAPNGAPTTTPSTGGAR